MCCGTQDYIGTKLEATVIKYHDAGLRSVYSSCINMAHVNIQHRNETVQWDYDLFNILFENCENGNFIDER